MRCHTVRQQMRSLHVFIPSRASVIKSHCLEFNADTNPSQSMQGLTTAHCMPGMEDILLTSVNPSMKLT